MEILKTTAQMKALSKAKKKTGRTICFVPTMGYLHQAHISLMEKGKPLCDELVISIFVNPSQFGPNEDLDSYPSDIETDLDLARKAGVTAVFLPDKTQIYPDTFQTEVRLLHLPKVLCGKFRPVHFAGVTTIVTKLFNIVMPDKAVFGQKDYQQLRIIRQMTLDLDFDIEIVAGEIIREKDGLAMSSRNAYLSDTQRQSALSLSKALALAREIIKKGETDTASIQIEIDKFIHSFKQTQVEYIEFCDPGTLEQVSIIDRTVLLALSVKVGTTRLIDNALIDP